MKNDELLALTTDIVVSHLSNNSVPVSELPKLIEEVFTSLKTIGAEESTATAERPEPAVPVKKSVTPDYVICLEDGKKLKMLKRYIKTRFDLTPEEYRERWGLPADYPMVAPNYAKQRQALAKKIGLGTRRKKG